MEEKEHSVIGGPPEMKEEAQWKLYEAFNELHSLAQEFSTPFDAPAVLVLGHQTDGKSALVKALMGFQDAIKIDDDLLEYSERSLETLNEIGCFHKETGGFRAARCGNCVIKE